MQNKTTPCTFAVKPLLGLVLTLLALGTASTAKAVTFTYDFDVEINLSSLPTGTYSLDMQLVNGGGAAVNTVQVSNFSGAGFTGTPTLNSATASGGTVTLSDASSILSEFTQQITPGDLTFEVQMTTNVDPTQSPDEFSFGVLDSTGAEIPTLDPSGGNSFLTADINGSTPTINTYASDPSQSMVAGGTANINAPSITAVANGTNTPEFSDLTPLALGGIPMLGLYWRSRRYKSRKP